MSIETKTDLNQSTIDGIQKLIRYNIDSCDGYRESADLVTDPVASSLFKDIAEQRSEFANKLQNYVEINGEEACDDGSIMAAVHRKWIEVRTAISGGDVYPVLCEAERGEDYIKGAYEDVLVATAGSALNDVLTQQYAQVKQGHDAIRNLRDGLKKAE